MKTMLVTLLLCVGLSPSAHAAFSVPGRIQAEDYLAGTNGDQYRDTTPGNSGGAYRNGDVDILKTSDGGYKVGYIRTGEWLKFPITVAKSGTYYLRLRVARGLSGTSTGGIQAQINGSPITSVVSIPSTKNWEKFTTLTREVQLSAGSSTLSLYFAGGDFDLNWVEFALKSSSSPTPTPPPPTPTPTPTPPPPTPTPVPSVPKPTGLSGNFSLIFQDEFNGTALDTSKWNMGYRWSQNVDGGPQTIINRESQYYHRNNVSVHDGKLDIVMKNEYVQGQPYTSGAISSHDKFFFTYGIMEARMKVPKGDGQWPAFWAMFQDTSKPYKEIDVLELSGKRTYEAAMTYHWESGNSGWHAYLGPDYSLDYHTFAVEWSPSALIWYIDGVERYRFTDTSKIVNYNMYLLLNMAMAPTSCNWIGCPDGTKLPANFLVDYVRVWKRQ